MKKRRSIATFLVSAMIALGCTADGQIPQELIDALLTQTSQPEDRTTAGLREALQVATTRAVNSTSQAGGFSADDLIRIRLPDALDRPASALRLVGLGSYVDDLETGMNLAAESAASAATPLFMDAVRSLTFADARAILQGGDTAATDFFRGKTEPRLVARFKPEVQTSMRKVGLYEEYEDLLGAYTRLPLTEKPNLDLADHVTKRTVDGLFEVLGREEQKIRRDPVARTTELLREVFGR